MDGQPWRWKGVSAFALLDRFAKGEDISGFLSDCVGFNVLRVFPYVPAKDWGAQAWDAPDRETVGRFVDHCRMQGFYTELTLLTDDDPARIGPAADLVRFLTTSRMTSVLIEIGNEPTTHKAIDTAALRRVCEDSGLLFSSGDYEDSRHWFGRYLTYHSGRDGEWPRRAHDALDYYQGGGPNFPAEPACRVPCIADEPIRPDQASGDRDGDFLAYFAAASILGGGATFHCNSGKYAQRFTDEEKHFAAIALQGLNAFPADAPKGSYQRPVENTLRTYIVGNCRVRIRPTSVDML